MFLGLFKYNHNDSIFFRFEYFFKVLHWITLPIKFRLFMFSILTIGVIIREDYKLHFENVIVTTSYKIFYTKSCYAQSFFTERKCRGCVYRQDWISRGCLVYPLWTMMYTNLYMYIMLTLNTFLRLYTIGRAPSP